MARTQFTRQVDFNWNSCFWVPLECERAQTAHTASCGTISPSLALFHTPTAAVLGGDQATWGVCTSGNERTSRDDHGGGMLPCQLQFDQ